MGEGRALNKVVAGGAAVCLLVVGCGDAADDEGVTLRFAWWGNEHRHEITQEIIDIYEQENPHVSIETEYGGSFEDHWDRLATQVAGGDAPDVIQMDEQYLREYADRGALHSLDEVDVSEFSETAVANGRVEDELLAVTLGLNAPTVLANVDVFQSAGVDVPDDDTWTWEDFADVAAEISEGSDDVWGSAGPLGIAPFQVWLRQSGAHLATDEGELGFSVAEAQAYFEYFKDLLDAEVLPPAAVIQEDRAAPEEQTLSGTGREALATRWTNQAVGSAQASGASLELLRYPGMSDSDDDPLWLKSSMYLSVPATTDHPQEAQQFIDFFVNSEDAAQIAQVERGVPPNMAVRELVVDDLDDLDAETVAFIERLEAEEAEPEPLAPVGSSDFQPTVDRYLMEVFFDRLSPEQAAEDLVAELEGQLG
ncbi:ABC transporter substrate-binding protein [Nesterenkonia sp. HG001]|uniref:ABC transporter substrate-binding protein n=1 Tax=Nesterenkonia sp. HG001 TaxID=2983207 RepID=UPI002AC42EDB|nr:ABC transporter substrate-binding protein [Nesterenkonia sp. HG001]MDZ5078314.1 ABC transporter substrate-binding protein [Nesterenkonia sp. HG001]